ncbi:hypothetical protein OIU76_005321 [Salix suchowensis]|nr:hypothetical protein OIU76_005321 [Salix suchowensis]
MGIVKILAAALLAAFLLLDPMTEAAPDPPQRPLCMPQFSLVNQACDSVILGTPLPNHSLTSGDGEGHGHGRRHGRRHRHRQGAWGTVTTDHLPQKTTAANG